MTEQATEMSLNEKIQKAKASDETGNARQRIHRKRGGIVKYLIIFIAALTATASDSVLKRAATHVLMKNEGFRAKPYFCTNGHATVGYGHKIVDKAKSIYTKAEAKILLGHDIDAKLKVCRRLLPAFDGYPVCVQVSILDGVFRGDLSGSPKTLKLIRQSKWVEASKEYLDNREYRKSKQNGTGVYKRMNRNAMVFLQYGEKLK